MMTIDEIRESACQVTYLDWVFFIGGDQERPYLQLHFNSPCTKTGEMKEWHSRKWWLSQHMIHSEIIQTAYKAVEAAVLHEMRESFLYCGRAIYDPHIDVDVMWTIATTSNHANR